MGSESSKNRFTTHDLSKTVEYRIYHGIKMRCYNTKNKKYADYGGRGIVMAHPDYVVGDDNDEWHTFCHVEKKY